jgi:hypothetical protein
MLDAEKLLFLAFVLPQKRQRYDELLDSKRGREKIRLSLDHFKDLDPRVRRKVKSSEQNPAGIFRILTGLGAPSRCYVISSNSDLDGREMDRPSR